jgi:hypothetical protein
MSNHTKGPWRIDGNYIAGTDAKTVAIIGNVDTCHFPVDEDEATPNAHLIAAAPEMLEALEYARGIIAMKLGERSAHLNPLDAAITKAKGEQ